MQGWVNKYIGIPYKLHSQTMEACDCYGLLRLVFEKEFGILLPSFSAEYGADSKPQRIEELYSQHMSSWKQVEAPAVGDAVFFNVAGLAKHVGVVVSDKHFLHNLKEPGSSTVADFTGRRWRNRMIGFYRHEQRRST